MQRGSRYEVQYGSPRNPKVIKTNKTLLPIVEWARHSTRARRAVEQGKTLRVVRIEEVSRSVVQEVTPR